jgi:hypothetical protein
MYKKSIVTRTILGVAVFISAIVFLNIKSTLAFSGSGTGASADPYRITSCDQLQEISNGLSSSYVVTSNLDCSTTTAWNSGQGFVPLTTFTGSFDGRNHTIDGLYMNRTGNNNGNGLFGIINGATIKNVSLTNASTTFTSGYYTGGVVGGASNSNISGVSFSGKILGPAAGGVVSFLQASSSLSRSAMHGSIIDNGGYGGGLANFVYDSSVADSYTDASLVGSNSTGGLASRAYVQYGSASISRSYAAGTVKSSNYRTSFVAFVEKFGGSGTISFADNLSASSYVNDADAYKLTNFYGNVGGSYQYTPIITNGVFDATKANGGIITACGSYGTQTDCTNVNSNTLVNNSTSSPFVASGTQKWDFTNVWQVQAASLPTLRSTIISPEAPTAATSSNPTGTGATISWTAPAVNGGAAVSSYVINYRKQGVTAWTQVNIGSIDTSYTLSGLATSTNYQFEVAAVNSAGQGLVSDTGTFTTASTNYYTLTYAAGAGGALSGSSSQIVASGLNGSAVTAVPNAGYHFVNWSDASTTNPRTDYNITMATSVTANFAVITKPEFIDPTPANGATVFSTNIATPTISVDSSVFFSGEHEIIMDANSSLQGWWPLNTAGDFSDYSGNENTATNNGATATSSGKYAGAYSFNGSSNYLDMGIPAAAQVQNNLTMSAWIKTTNTSASYHDIIANQWQLNSSGIMVTLYGAATIHVPFSNDTTFDYLDATATTTDGNWHLITVTFSSGTVRIFVDGVEKSSKTSTTVTQINYNDSNHLLIGRDSAVGGTEYFNGSIDNVQIYSRVLATAEILALYNAYSNPYLALSANIATGTNNILAYAQNTSGNISSTTLRSFTWSPIPSAPTAIATSSIAASSFALSWTDNSSDETGFIIEKSTDGSTFSSATTTAANTTTASVTGLSANTEYWFRVGAYNNNGTSTYATTTSGAYTSAANPTITVTADSRTAITVAWSGGTADYYEAKQGATTATTTGASYQFTDLTCDTTYNFQIRSYNSNGIATDYTDPVNATTAACPAVAGGSSFLSMPSVGSGVVDVTIPMNEQRAISEIKPNGTNVLAYVGSTGGFNITVSQTKSITEHHLKILSVDMINKKITVEITSEPKTIELEVGEIKKIDLDNDNISDMSLTFNKLLNNRVDLTINQLAFNDTKKAEEKTAAVAPVKKSATYKFTRDLKYGMSGADVKELQKYLNVNGFTVAKSGIGSSGKETTQFGPATKAALIKFQKAKKIIPAVGYFGPVTRRVIN